MIVFDSAVKRFGKRTALDDINLEIKPGEFVSIVGPVGSGKTTLIKLILGDEELSEGALFVSGSDLRFLKGEDLQKHRRSIGAIFQDYKLLPRKTVFENVAFALEVCDFSLPEIMELAPQALASAGIEHLQDKFPHELSGGEAQKAAFARAIAHKPKIILADEPTGNLDIESAKETLKNLIKINLNGATVIFTTHNKPLVDLIGQKVVYIKEGRLAGDI